MLKDLIYDAWRFLLKARVYIDEFPLQVYYTAVPFAPRNSFIRRAYEDKYTGIVQSSTIVKYDWDYELQRFNVGVSPPLSFSFVADDSCLAVVTHKGDLLTFDIATGALLNCSMYLLRKNHSGSLVEGCPPLRSENFDEVDVFFLS